jgi:hypothetical protein
MSFIKVPLLRGFTEIEFLYRLAEKYNMIICGGYARYCASPNPNPIKAGDIDLFPKNENSFELIKEELLNIGYEIKYENDISISFKIKEEADIKIKISPVPQIIKPVKERAIITTGSIEEILDNFDFTIVRAAIINKTTVIVDEDFLNDESYYILRLKNIHCPVSSLLRCCKYARKGYYMRPAEAIKLFNDWMDRDDNYRIRLIELFERSALGGFDPEENPNGMTQEEIDEMEALLRID